MNNTSKVLLILTIFLTSCVGISRGGKNISKHPNKSQIISLSNEGSICFKRASQNSLEIKYYPLSTSCYSSSAIDMKLNGVDVKTDGDKVYVDSYSLFKLNKSPIATADCGGANVVRKLISIPSNSSEIYLGKTKIVDISNLKGSYCYKKVGSGYKRVKPLK